MSKRKHDRADSPSAHAAANRRTQRLRIINMAFGGGFKDACLRHARRR